MVSTFDEFGGGSTIVDDPAETLTRPGCLLPVVQVVVPAAGEGSRMGELAANRPKGLVDVAGKPLLAHVFEAVLPLDVEELLVVVARRDGPIADRFGPSYGGTPIRYVHQPEPRGLGHAVLTAEPHVEGDFAVVNGDNAIDADLGPVLDHHREASPAATVPVEAVSPAVARETGVAVVEDGRVRAVVERPDDPPSDLALTGVFVLPPAIFDALRLATPSARGELELSDAIDLLARGGRRVDAVEFPGWRLNVNSPADVEAAADRFR